MVADNARGFVYKSYAKLPKQILRHPCHCQHPLNLCVKNPQPDCEEEYHCASCKRSCKDFSFQSEQCGFILYVRCASLKPPESYEGHPHPLVYLPENYSRRKCNICNVTKFGLVLRCGECSFNVHESCIRLPKPTQHPYHPLHLLNPGYPTSLADLSCNACKEGISRPAYSCAHCRFLLHRSCALQLPPTTIRCKGHKHLLLVFNDFNENEVCTSCRTLCGTAVVCRCVACNFTLHLHSHPSLLIYLYMDVTLIPQLLCVLLSKKTTFPTSFIVTLARQDETHRHPVYYCPECDFVANVECVISEVCPHFTLLLNLVMPQFSANFMGPKIFNTRFDCQVLPSLIVEQGSHWAIKGKLKPASSGEGFSGATMRNEAMARGVSTSLPSEKVEVVEVAADFNLPKLNEEIAEVSLKQIQNFSFKLTISLN
ncbi:hypothetical protein L1049_001554 [Liquidambar formosana]|uniref:Phorbol-ester/DAG-type domain-containing protein n=1 Tax=Liquidambar formosana TaxID=63359 RepID=A0AAP0R8E2_LIQFO